jgi:CrcB protein
VLGGYTTFSTAMVDVRDMVTGGAPALALLYLGGTAVTALIATAAGWFGARAVTARRRSAAAP